MSDSNLRKLKLKKVISIIFIVIGLPLSLSYASEGGSLMAIPFGALLALGIDMLTDTNKALKQLR